MQGYLTVIRTDGAVETEPIAGEPALERLQGIVGGYIERVPFFDRMPDGAPCVAFCNEDGKLRGLAHNAAATLLWSRQPDFHLLAADHLVGNVAILWGDAEFMASL